MRSLTRYPQLRPHSSVPSNPNLHSVTLLQLQAAMAGAVTSFLNMGIGTVNYDLTALLSRILLSPLLVAGHYLQPHPRLLLYLKVENSLTCRSILHWPLHTYRKQANLRRPG